MRKQPAHDGAIRATLTGAAVLSAKRGGDQNHPRALLDYYDDACTFWTLYIEAAMRKQRAHDGAIRATLSRAAVLSAKRGGDQNHPRAVLDYHDDAGVIRAFNVEVEMSVRTLNEMINASIGAAFQPFIACSPHQCLTFALTR